MPFLFPSEVTICSSGCWLCVSLGWRDSSPLLKFRGFINDSREYFGGRGTARCPLPHSFREYIFAVAVYVGGERIAHCLPPHNVGMYLGGRGTGHLPHKIGEFLGGGGTGPPPHNVGLYFGGGGTGLLPRNVGEYMQLVLRSQFRSLALFLPPTAKSWKKRGMHCECKTCWWRGSNRECLEHVSFAGSPRVANAHVDTSHSHKCQQLQTRFRQCSLRRDLDQGGRTHRQQDVGEQCKRGFAGHRDAPGRELFSCKLGRRESRLSPGFVDDL